MNIVFAGTPEFAVPTLQALHASQHAVIQVYTQPDKEAGRGKQLHQSPIKQWAMAHHIPVRQPVSFKDREEQDYLKALKPDVVIVVAYGLILPQIILDIPRWGCINVHASLLPRWRGASPIQQAILAGDKETGVSIMQMEKGLDTGPVFMQSICPILPNDTAGTLHDRLAGLGAETALKVLSHLETLVPEQQNSSEACYAGKITKQEGQIDWTLSAFEIDRKVRAFNPWPIAYSYVKGEYVRIWKGEVLSEKTQESPGTIIAVTPKGIDIAAGHQTQFRITYLQLASAKALSAHDYFNAHHGLFTAGLQL